MGVAERERAYSSLIGLNGPHLAPVPNRWSKSTVPP
jgi:hypothetical protein